MILITKIEIPRFVGSLIILMVSDTGPDKKYGWIILVPQCVAEQHAIKPLQNGYKRFFFWTTVIDANTQMNYRMVWQQLGQKYNYFVKMQLTSCICMTSS